MTIREARENTVRSVENAIAHLADALTELDRMPVGDQTTGFVAHALNNYLSVADATLYLLSEVLHDHPDREVAVWLSGLRHLGRQMQHTVTRLVHPATAADFPLRAEWIDLPQLMTRACDYYRRAADAKQLEIICRPMGAIPPAWADRVGVAVVVDNLLSNAVKFSRPAGIILAQIQSGPGGVVCSVRDAGPGLTPAQQTQLLQKGLHDGPAPTGGEPSNGYGLLIVKELVGRMGGRVWVESEPGRGACFSFSVPYRPPDSNSE